METQDFASLLTNRELKTDNHLSLPVFNRWHDVAYWGLMLVACAVFYWMNVLTPFKEDDMLHSMVIGDLTPINSVSDLLHCWWNKYLITNGRSSDMVAELFCGLLGTGVDIAMRYPQVAKPCTTGTYKKQIRGSKENQRFRGSVFLMGTR